jgi:hypothetical protein
MATAPHETPEPPTKNRQIAAEIKIPEWFLPFVKKAFGT